MPVREQVERGSVDASDEALLAVLDAAVVRESNLALAQGALVGAGLGLAGTCAVPLGMSGLLAVPPAAFGISASAFSLALYWLARRGRVHGVTAWTLMLVFVSLPTGFFVLSHVLLETGAATYLNGPIGWVYFVIIAISGSLFRARISIATGLVASLGYLLSYGLAYPQLTQLRGPPELLVDLVDPAINVIRVFMLVATGLAVGGLATLGRRLTTRALREQQAKEDVSRLFGEYVSEEVKAKILESRTDAGERKRVVILFSDVRGFTQLSEGADPEAMVRRLNQYFDGMVDAIGREGGIVDKFVGDAVMAVFGGVLELDNPDAAAVRAAIGMRERLAELRKQWEGEAIAPFDNGIGIHAGEVLQGAIGAKHRKDFTVIGDAVNTASRLEGLTKDAGYPIVVSDEILSKLPDALQARCEPLGDKSVKGRARAIALYGIRA